MSDNEKILIILKFIKSIYAIIPINKSDEEIVDKLVANATRNKIRRKLKNKKYNL